MIDIDRVRAGEISYDDAITAINSVVCRGSINVLEEDELSQCIQDNRDTQEMLKEHRGR